MYTKSILRITCINDLISVYTECITYNLYTLSYQRIQLLYLERAIYVPAPRLHEVKLAVCSEDQVAAPINLDLPPEEVGWNDCMIKLKHFIYLLYYY